MLNTMRTGYQLLPWQAFPAPHSPKSVLGALQTAIADHVAVCISVLWLATASLSSTANNLHHVFIPRFTPTFFAFPTPPQHCASMVDKCVNRFAILGEDNRSSPSSASSSPAEPNQKENEWEQVKSRSHHHIKVPVKTLVICDEKQHTRYRLATKLNSPHLADTRKVSSSSDGSGKAFNPNENWCGVCQVRFATKQQLLSHIKQTPKHENYCNLCRRVFKDRNGLKNHVDNAMDHDVFCNLCLSAFKDKWGLRNHFENNYSVGHEFVCLTCLMGFKSRNEMEIHLRKAKKHVRCDTCHRDFRTQDERDEHWRKTASEFHTCLTTVH